MTRIEKLRKEAVDEVRAEIDSMLKSVAHFKVPAQAPDTRPEQQFRPGVVSRSTKRTFIIPDLQEIHERMKREGRIKPFPASLRKPQTTEAQLLAKYPHAIAGTIRQEAGHRTIEAKLKCGHRVRLHTSDLFQVKRCKACKSK